MSYQAVLNEILDESKSRIGEGKVADYIPALAKMNPNQLGIAIHTVDGETISAGDDYQRFTIQSVSKVLSLTLALQRYGDDLWKRVGKEPSGTAFNSLTQLEFEQGIPRNPFVNTGALVVADALVSRLSAPIHAVLENVRALSGNANIMLDRQVARSEYEHRHRNAAMAHLMKSFGNFENDVDQVLQAYFSFCAIELNCRELATTFSFLAQQGFSQEASTQMLTSKQTQQMNSLLFTSGLYDAAGDFAYRVGMPGKSGVSGAIVAVCPGRFTVAVWSPELNSYGNSVAGLHALEMLADKLDIALF
ncbi:glutaminase B [Flocculibacter collagenilyticus]|uniref:glutaminase B n=1 Tax=Flocculibacter collagenilyticus TaxID=2744479 RepID=UPI0018F7CE63|nr:glutaminase B [Flocculibacter collagenilyticus]